MKFQASLEEVLNSVDLKVEKLSQDVLSYLAYETLGQLVEMALLVRRDTCGDPVARLVPLRSVNIEYPSVHLPLPAPATDKPEAITELSGHPITTAEVCTYNYKVWQDTAMLLFAGERGFEETAAESYF